MYFLFTCILSVCICLTTVSVLLNTNSKQLTEYLDSRLKTTGKEAIRIVFNINEYLNSFLVEIYNKIKGSELKGEYGGEVDYMMVYPMKGVSSGLKVTEWKICDYGLYGDRQYSIGSYEKDLDAYRIMGLKNNPNMGTVRMSFDEPSKSFTYTWVTEEGKTDSFTLPAEPDKEFIDKYGDSTKTSDVFKTYSSYMTGYALDKYKMPKSFIKTMKLPENSILMCSPKGKPCKIGVPKDMKVQTKFQAYYPILMCSNQSLAELQNRCIDKGFQIHMGAFRPTLVVNVPKAFDEDYYEYFDLVSSGNYRHTIKAPIRCLRCVLPNLDYKTGTFDKKSNVSKTLAKSRRVDENFPYGGFFGKYALNIDPTFTIKRGDKLDVTLKQVKCWQENPFKKNNKRPIV